MTFTIPLVKNFSPPSAAVFKGGILKGGVYSDIFRLCAEAKSKKSKPEFTDTSNSLNKKLMLF